MLKVRVPPGTRPGQVLRLTDRGLPNFGEAGRGDLKLRIEIRIPEYRSRE